MTRTDSSALKCVPRRTNGERKEERERRLHRGRARRGDQNTREQRDPSRHADQSRLPGRPKAARKPESAYAFVLKTKTSSSGPTEFELRVSDQTMWTVLPLAAMLE